MKKWGAVFAAAALAAAVLIPVISGTRKTEVTYGRASLGSIEVCMELAGSIEAMQVSTVLCDSQGRVSDVLVSVGDSVNKGQKLLELEGSETGEPAAQAMAEIKSGAATESKKNAKELAQSVGCDINTFNACMSAKESAAEVFSEQPRAGKSSLSAPISGKIVELTAAKGGYLGAGSPAVVIADTQSCIIGAMVNEDDIDDIYTGMPVTFTIEGKPASFSGSVTGIADTITLSASQKKQIRIEITPEEKLSGILGRSADIRLVVKRVENVVTVPADAVMDGWIFIIGEDGLLEKREVTTGISDGVRTEIVTGAYNGEQMVADPTDELNEGMAVEKSDRA